MKRHKLPTPTVISPPVLRVPFFCFFLHFVFPPYSLSIEPSPPAHLSPRLDGGDRGSLHLHLDGGEPREGIGNSSRTGTDATRWWKRTTVIISAPHPVPRTDRESIMLQSGSNQQHNKRGTWTEAHNFPFPGHGDPRHGKARASDWTAFCNPALMLKEPWALVIQIVTR